VLREPATSAIAQGHRTRRRLPLRRAACVIESAEPLSARSRDNLPNPIADEDDPYVPVNGPAISDLFVMFEFQHDHDHRNHE
jgi:hypothetical protein